LRRSGFNVNVRGPNKAKQTRAAQALVNDYITGKRWEFSIAQAAKEMGIHQTTVRKYLKLAITAGLAELTDSRRVDGGRPTNFYSRTRHTRS
jgi:predicted ArsR family transcriptional regulator